MSKDITKGLKDGYYLISSKKDTQKSLVYLYDHPDFNGVRHISFGHPDGFALMPVWDLSEDSILEPVNISIGSKPTTLKDLDKLGVDS